MQDHSKAPSEQEPANGSNSVATYAVDELLLQKKLGMGCVVLQVVWVIGILLFLLRAVAEGVKFPPPLPWVVAFCFLVLLGPVLMYLYKMAQNADLAENFGAELQICGERCTLRRPMRRDFQCVEFEIGCLRNVYVDGNSIVIMFGKRKPWMRRALPGFYPTIRLIGLPGARDAARTLAVRSGIVVKWRRARRRGRKMSVIAWLFIAIAWPLFVMAHVIFPTVSTDSFAVVGVGLFVFTATMVFSTFQSRMYRCKIMLIRRRRHKI